MVIQVAPGDPDGYQPPVPTAGLTVDGRVLWGREFLLDGPSMERAVTFGDSSRLRRQVARMMAGETRLPLLAGTALGVGCLLHMVHPTRPAFTVC